MTSLTPPGFAMGDQFLDLMKSAKSQDGAAEYSYILLNKTTFRDFAVIDRENSLFLIFVKKQSQELTRVNPDRNIFSINVELTSTFLLYRVWSITINEF